MGLIFDKGETRLIADHVASLIPSRTPTVPDAYKNLPAGDLDGWPREAIHLLLDEGRRSLDGVNARFERLRDRAQYLLGIAVASLGAQISLTHLMLDNIGVFLLWAVAVVLVGAALVVSFAAFAATAELGSVDPVLFSREQPPSGTEAAASLARAYAKAFQRSSNTVLARFTLYRDATWLLVLGVLIAIVAWVVATTNT